MGVQMKKFLIVILGTIVLIVVYGFVDWLFPFSPLGIKQDITYSSTIEQVKQYKSLNTSIDHLQSSNDRYRIEVKDIFNNLSQQWAMEDNVIKISINDIHTMDIYVSKVKIILDNLKKDNLQEEALIELENNINLVLQDIKVLKENSWVSRFYINEAILRIRNYSYEALKNLETFLRNV